MDPAAPTLSVEEDRLARLEDELKASHETDRRRNAAFAQLHGKLEEALLTVSQQEKQLAVLRRKVESNRPVDLPKLLLGWYSKLATVADATPSAPVILRSDRDEAASQRIAALWQRLPWKTGSITPADEDFLNAVIDKLRPERVYEIGVASGSSSAFILNSMAAHADPAGTWLHSYDIATQCYFDENMAVGSATRLMVPELLGRWKLNLGRTVLDVPRDPESRSLYFIDADHAHPAPTLDLIALLSRLRPGDHVVLHDINLPKMYGGNHTDTGASWLFEDWLGERFWSDEAVPNIGAIVIPDDRTLVRGSLARTLARPWGDWLSGQEDRLKLFEQRLADFLSLP